MIIIIYIRENTDIINYIKEKSSKLSLTIYRASEVESNLGYIVLDL